MTLQKREQDIVRLIGPEVHMDAAVEGAHRDAGLVVPHPVGCACKATDAAKLILDGGYEAERFGWAAGSLAVIGRTGARCSLILDVHRTAKRVYRADSSSLNAVVGKTIFGHRRADGRVLFAPGRWRQEIIYAQKRRDRQAGEH